MGKIYCRYVISNAQKLSTCLLLPHFNIVLGFLFIIWLRERNLLFMVCSELKSYKNMWTLLCEIVHMEQEPLSRLWWNLVSGGFTKMYAPHFIFTHWGISRKFVTNEHKGCHFQLKEVWGPRDKVMVAVRQEHHMYHLIETSLTSLIKWKFTKQSLHICTDVTLMTTVYINTEYHTMQ